MEDKDDGWTQASKASMTAVRRSESPSGIRTLSGPFSFLIRIALVAVGNVGIAPTSTFGHPGNLSSGFLRDGSLVNFKWMSMYINLGSKLLGKNAHAGVGKGSGLLRT